jgi:hypothetical protein
VLLIKARIHLKNSFLKTVNVKLTKGYFELPNGPF